VIVGDGNGMVGVGYGKAKEVPCRDRQGCRGGSQGLLPGPLIGGTITHPVQGEAAAGVVMLRPASPGTGVIAGGAARAVLECAGVHDILAKSLGSDNAINVVHATVAALKLLQRPEEVAARRGLSIEDVAPQACCGRAGRRRRLPRRPHVKGRRKPWQSSRSPRCAAPSVRAGRHARAFGRWAAKIRQSVVREDNAQTRGLIKAVHHLVRVEEV
jgi:ribosomal protein S5